MEHDYGKTSPDKIKTFWELSGSDGAHQAQLLSQLLAREPLSVHVADSDGDTALHHVAQATELEAPRRMPRIAVFLCQILARPYRATGITGITRITGIWVLICVRQQSLRGLLLKLNQMRSYNSTRTNAMHKWANRPHCFRGVICWERSFLSFHRRSISSRCCNSCWRPRQMWR